MCVRRLVWHGRRRVTFVRRIAPGPEPEIQVDVRRRYEYIPCWIFYRLGHRCLAWSEEHWRSVVLVRTGVRACVTIHDSFVFGSDSIGSFFTCVRYQCLSLICFRFDFGWLLVIALQTGSGCLCHMICVLLYRHTISGRSRSDGEKQVEGKKKRRREKNEQKQETSRVTKK